MANPLYIEAAYGSRAELQYLIDALNAQPEKQYNELAKFLFNNDPQNSVTDELRSKLTQRLAHPSVTDFNWDFILSHGQSILNLLTQRAYSCDIFRPALSLLLEHSIKRWNWNNHVKNYSSSPLFWVMVSIYSGYITSDVIEHFSQPHFDWNIPTEINETPLFWYVFALSQNYENMKHTVPIVLCRANLNWLKTVTDNTGKNGKSPLSILIEASIIQEAFNDHIHAILDKLFETEPNFPTFWDDMLKANDTEIFVRKAQDLLRTNRGRKAYQPLSPFNHELKSFFERLRHTRSTPIGPKLVKYVHEKTRNDLLDFVIPSNIPKKSPSNVDTTLMYQHLNALKPGASYRIPKGFWGLNRTINILRSVEGEYQFILETKSKLSDHSISNPRKCRVNQRNGSFKVGKPAWRIDNGVTKYFHLICRSNKNEVIETTQKEAVLSQKLGKHTKHINKYQQGLLRHKNKTQQQELFALGAKGSIHDFKSWVLIRSEKSKYKLIMDLLRGCLVIYQNGMVHQDITLKNVLLMAYNRNPYLTLSDFGTLKGVGQKQADKRTTFGFESPELEVYYPEYHSQNKYPSFAKDIYFDQNLRHKIESPNSLDPNPANDIWSIGIIAHIILNGWNHPTLNDIPKIQANELLKGMLAIKRSERIAIDQAIALCEMKINEVNEVNDLKAQPVLSQFNLDRQRASSSRSRLKPEQGSLARQPKDDTKLSTNSPLRQVH